MKKLYPLKMTPHYAEYLWGGQRLRQKYHKQNAPAILAESWELADLPAGQSLTEDGKSLDELARIDKAAYWGASIPFDRFPVLVKLIDAAKDLSIQVHPSDENARRELGEQGKAEMWYVVDCEPGAFLYLGFAKEMSRDELISRAQDGTICEVLNRVLVKPGDTYYILPGTIHAIGAGILIAEIQQSSNTTFRIYDYQRRDAQGNLRPLHLERAAEVMNYQKLIPADCKPENTEHRGGYDITRMFQCEYFSAYMLDVIERADLECDGTTAHHLLCVEGEGKILYMDEEYPILCGESYFIPAAMGKYKVVGKSRILLSCR